MVNTARADRTTTAVRPFVLQRRIYVCVLVVADCSVVGYVSRDGNIDICSNMVPLNPFGPSRTDKDRGIPRVVAGVGGGPSEFVLAG